MGTGERGWEQRRGDGDRGQRWARRHGTGKGTANGSQDKDGGHRRGTWDSNRAEGEVMGTGGRECRHRPQGKKFVGDLGSDGTITWQETGQVFNSPSAWATHCKRLVNPAKKSGCGWASVRYKGQKLDQYKAAWLRQHQPNVPPPEEVRQPSPAPGTPRLRGEPGASPVCPQSLASEGEEEELPEDEEEEAAREGRVPAPEPAAPKKPEERSKKQQGKSVAEPAGTGELPRGCRGSRAARPR